nr:DUF4365 domain-containing protein [Haloferax larsenii]
MDTPFESRPKRYTKPSQTENATLAVLILLLHENSVAVRWKGGNEPNYDGSIHLLNPDNRPQKRLAYQLKKLPARFRDRPRLQVDTEVLDYANVTEDPFLLFASDIDHKQVYWFHISPEWLRENQAKINKQDTKIVEFPKENVITESTTAHVDRWSELGSSHVSKSDEELNFGSSINTIQPSDSYRDGRQSDLILFTEISSPSVVHFEPMFGLFDYNLYQSKTNFVTTPVNEFLNTLSNLATEWKLTSQEAGFGIVNKCRGWVGNGLSDFATALKESRKRLNHTDSSKIRNCEEMFGLLLSIDGTWVVVNGDHHVDDQLINNLRTTVYSNGVPTQIESVERALSTFSFKLNNAQPVNESDVVRKELYTEVEPRKFIFEEQSGRQWATRVLIDNPLEKNNSLPMPPESVPETVVMQLRHHALKRNVNNYKYRVEDVSVSATGSSHNFALIGNWYE